jgi:hypothetical protein
MVGPVLIVALLRRSSWRSARSSRDTLAQYGSVRKGKSLAVRTQRDTMSAQFQIRRGCLSVLSGFDLKFDRLAVAEFLQS